MSTAGAQMGSGVAARAASRWAGSDRPPRGGFRAGSAPLGTGGSTDHMPGAGRHRRHSSRDPGQGPSAGRPAVPRVRQPLECLGHPRAHHRDTRPAPGHGGRSAARRPQPTRPPLPRPGDRRPAAPPSRGSRLGRSRRPFRERSPCDLSGRRHRPGRSTAAFQVGPFAPRDRGGSTGGPGCDPPVDRPTAPGSKAKDSARCDVRGDPRTDRDCGPRGQGTAVTSRPGRVGGAQVSWPRGWRGRTCRPLPSTAGPAVGPPSFLPTFTSSADTRRAPTPDEPGTQQFVVRMVFVPNDPGG